MISDDPMELAASPARRWFALAVLGVLALLLAALALRPPMGLGSRVALIAMAGGVVYAAMRFHDATARSVVLTADGVFDSDGREIARMEHIKSVERGVFAFKPSNGFLLRLDHRRGRAWQPGLWWRRGRIVGIGGVTPASPAKAMAEAIALHIAGR